MKNILRNTHRHMRIPLVLIALLIAMPSLLPAETAETLTVTVRENQTLRDIAKEYLSESNAGILFRDESRLRLDQNSLALIQKMRSNKLKNTQDSHIMLLEGDLSALLTGSGGGDNFRLEIPDIDTAIRSNRFWVSRDKKSTRFSNYDGELEISTAEDKLVIGKNQGSVVGRRQKRLSLHNLLPRTNLISPASFATVPSNRLVIEWESVKGAHSYWLEISADKMFNRAMYSEKAFTSTRYVWENVPPDIYYWRVSAVDKEGLPGPKSEVRVINVVKDTTPPYLIVNAPTNEEFVRDGIITVSGEAELGVTARVGENTLKLDPSGNFLSWIPLSDGSNVLSIEARDEAVNVTQRESKLLYLPDSELAVFNFDGTTNQISPNHFIVQEKGFILAGKTARNSCVNLKSLESAFKASTYADESGFFHFSVLLGHPNEEFICTRHTPFGQVIEERLVVEIRTGNPIIQFTQPLPEVTREKSLTLVGKLLNGTELRINGRKVSLSDGAFMETIELKPGTNSIRLEAYDEVKNLTIVNKRVILDRQAPTLLNVALSQEKARGGELIHIEIHANDHSMMKRSAPFTITVGSFVYDGFLTLSRAHNVYIGDVHLPLNARGKVELTKLLLEDYCGNRREYLF